MGDNDDEIARSRLSETSENDSVSSKENDSIAKASNLSFSSPSGPNIVKRSNVCQSPVFEVSSISTEPDSESSSEPDISQGIWARKFVDQLDSSVSSEVSSAKEYSPSENEGSSSGSEGQISSIEEDLNFSINRYCNYEESEHHTGDLTHDSDYTAKPPGSSCVVSEEENIDGYHPAKRFRPAALDDDDDDDDDDDESSSDVAISDTSQDNEASFSATQESMDESTPSEVESDVFNPSNGSTSSTDSDQEPSNTQLYAGSSISAKNFNAMFLALKQKHNLSSQAVDSVLRLVKLCLPEGNKCPASGYQFEKSLCHLGFQFKKHVTCCKCQHPLEDEICPNDQCTNAGMQAKGEKSSTFYIIDLLPEIERLITEHWLEMRNFVDNFVHQPGIYRDMMDGKVYQEHSTIIKVGGYFPITLYWHLDGAPALKSKNMSLWPIQSFVAELPLKLRYSYKNILLSGLWYGKKKPNMQVFQESFVTQVMCLSDGFQVTGQNTPKFKLTINGQAADLVAKGPSLNFKLFSGKWGCSVCLHPGRRLPGRGNRRIYEYKSIVFARRNHADSICYAQLAEETKQAVFGIMGTSPVHSILKIPDMLLLDYMHQVLEGEYTRRLSKWLGRTCPSEIEISEADQGEISQKLHSLILPHDFKRKFRPVEEFHKWKASEKQVLFLHAGLPILKAYLPAEHFYHHSLLVSAIRMLCEDEITDHDIDIADAMLATYTRLLPALFSETECTYNSHALTHLPEQVRAHGPLILHSTFVFEAMLAHLKRLFHGSRGIPDQICRKLGTTQHASQQIRMDVQDSSTAMEFTTKLMAAPKYSTVLNLENGVCFVPPFKQEIPYIAFPIEGFFPDTQELTTCQRMVKGGQVYHGLNYVYKKNSGSYLVQFEFQHHRPGFGEIQYFINHRNKGYAVVNILRNTGFNICSIGLAAAKDPVLIEFLSSGVLGSHFTGVERTQNFKVIPCDKIAARVTFVRSDDAGVDGYVSAVLKSYQHD